MKTIGLLGGMSWESTALYYSWINEGIKQKLGGLHSAQIVMVSVDFHEIEELQHKNRWDVAGEILSKKAYQIQAGGADFLLICTNTMHKVADQIEKAVQIPLLHIADATAKKVKEQGISKIGLLGTMFTMEEDFYAGRLEQYGLQVMLPAPEERKITHQIIYNELVLGQVRNDSRDAMLRIMNNLYQQGAQGIIEGCTEIVMLVQQKHTTMPLFDTTSIHAQAAIEMALAE